MTDYRYVAAELAHPGTPLAELPLTDVSWSRVINGAGEIKAKLKLPPPATVEARALITLWVEATDRATTAIYVLRDGVPQGAYVIWVQDYSTADQTITLSGAELFSYARRRNIEGPTLTTPVAFNGARPIDIARQLMFNINDIGLLFDIGTATGGNVITKSYVGTDDRKVANEVEELASSTDGFDFRTDIRIGTNGEYERVWVARARLDGSTGIIAKYGTNVTSLRAVRRGDLRTNDALALGTAPSEGTRPTGRSSSAAWRPPMTESVTLQTEDTAELAAAAASTLTARLDHQVLAVELISTENDGEVGTFMPGDYMRLQVNAGDDPFFHLGLDTLVRTLGYEVKVPDAGGPETVTLLVDEEP